MWLCKKDNSLGLCFYGFYTILSMRLLYFRTEDTFEVIPFDKIVKLKKLNKEL